MSTMSAQDSVEAAPAAPIWGELRYSGELASLLALTALRPAVYRLLERVLDAAARAPAPLAAVA